MPIITKPATVTKGSSALFTLSKSLLVANAVVAADAYYSVMANWKSIIVVFESSIGNQPEKLIFDASLATPTAYFNVPIQARDLFQVKRIDIYDLADGHISIPRANLVAADFDVSFAVVAPAPSGVNIRYFKMAGKQSWVDSDSINATGNIFAIAELKLKIAGVVETLTSYTKTGYNSPEALLGGNPLLSLTDGNDTSSTNLTYWVVDSTGYKDLFMIDLGATKSVSEVLVAAQLGNSDITKRKNMPKDFKCYGSSDGVTFTEILSIAETTQTQSSAWADARYKVFPV